MFEISKQLPCILVDLDGTIFDNSDRAHLVPPRSQWADPKAWAAYEREVGKDKIVWPVHELVSMLLHSGMFNVIYCTARFETSRYATMSQLKYADLLAGTNFGLAMRKAPADGKPAMTPGEFKAEVARRLTADGFLVQWAIDDSTEVCEALTAAGVTTLRVNSKCAAVMLENAEREQSLKEEQQAHRQTKEKLGQKLADNVALKQHIQRLSHELEAYRESNFDKPHDAYFMLREELELPPHVQLVDYVQRMQEVLTENNLMESVKNV